MKKYFFIFLCCITANLYAQEPQKLIIKSNGESKDVRYWPLDGIQLSYFDLSEVADVNSDGTVEIILPQDGCLYKILAGKQVFKVYAKSGGIDTVYLNKKPVQFAGSNKNYNDFLAEIEKSDRYSWAFRTTRNHELIKINNLTKFNYIIDSLKRADDELLKKGKFSKEFTEQQSLLTNMRYDELFLNKINYMLGSDEITGEWIEELKIKQELLSNVMAPQSDWYFRAAEEYILAKAVLIDNISPETIMDSMNNFLFDAFQAELTGNNLEYALACLLYDDIFQKEYSPEVPELYNRFAMLFPNSQYIDIIQPGAKEIEEMYSSHCDGVQIINYDKEPESFEDIIRPFKGKIIYVDIWATWCGPCLRMFSHLDTLKEQVKEINDLVFLYISLDRDNDAGKWPIMANHFKLDGYHYRTKGDMARVICSTFGNSKGALMIPRYIIVDKNGKIAFENAASPDQPDKVLQQLNSLVK